MKRLLIKPDCLLTFKKSPAGILPFIFLLLFFIFNGTTLFPQENKTDNSSSVKKRLEILEKLESGKAISTKDISDSFRQYANSDFDERDHVIISDSDLKELHDCLHRNMEDLRKNIESFRNSEEFLIMKDELQKWTDSFRKELEKIKDELKKSEREQGSKVIIHSQV